MNIINIIDEDIINYKEISMFVGLPYCSGKCWRDLGLPADTCQNECLRKSKIIDVDDDTLIKRFLDNDLTTAIVFGGMEPLDSFDELKSFVLKLRKKYNCNCKVVIYTGYTEDELKSNKMLDEISSWYNITIKVGRYIPNSKSRYDKVLGVTLASDNQYAIEL